MSFAVGQRAVVVDASVTIELLLGDPEWLEMWRHWTKSGDQLLVPPHFMLEVGNGLLHGARIGPSSAVAAMQWLFSAGIDVADRGLRGLEAALLLASAHRLTVYDAAYLDLAIDVDGELATLDQALRVAATAEGVPLIP